MNLSFQIPLLLSSLFDSNGNLQLHTKRS